MTYEYYDQPNGSGTNSGQTATSPAGGVYYFQDCPLDAEHLGSGELYLRLNTVDFPGISGPSYQSYTLAQRTLLSELPTPIPVGSTPPWNDMAPSD